MFFEKNLMLKSCNDLYFVKFWNKTYALLDSFFVLILFLIYTKGKVGWLSFSELLLFLQDTLT